MSMEIRLTCPEIHAILRTYVKDKFKVDIVESWSCKHNNGTEDAKAYGPVSFLFQFTPTTAPTVTPDSIGERRLDTTL